MASGWIGKKLRDLTAGRPAATVAPLAAEALKPALAQIQGLMRDGQFEAALVHLAPLVQSNPDRAEVWMDLGIVHYSLQRPADARTPLEHAIRLDPDSAPSYRFLLATLHALGDHAAVLHHALPARRLNPRDASLASIVGLAHLRVGDFDGAARHFNEGLAIEPESLSCLEGLEALSQTSTWHRRRYQLGAHTDEARRRAINHLRAAHRRHRLDAARLTTLLNLLEGDRSTFPAALELARAEIEFPEMSYALALRLASIFFTAGDAAQMLRLRETAFELEPADPAVRLALSYAWLSQGGEHWRTAWPMMTAALAELSPHLHVHEVPLWTGETRRNPKILVYQNQGLGDALMGLRLVPLLAKRGIRFDLWVLPDLVDFAAGVSGYENLIRSDARPDPRAHGCSYAVPLFGVIAALHLTPADLRAPGPLHSAPTRFRQWRERVSALPGKRIGLTFAGNPERRDDWLRAVPLEELETLASLSGVSWVNLMFDDRGERSAALSTFHMLDPMVEVRSLADTAALIEELDAVVAIDGSVAHLSGSLNRPTWVLAPTLADWHWQMGDDTHAWWPSARLLRSEAPGAWSAPVARLSHDLQDFVAGPARR